MEELKQKCGEATAEEEIQEQEDFLNQEVLEDKSHLLALSKNNQEDKQLETEHKRYRHKKKARLPEKDRHSLILEYIEKQREERDERIRKEFTRRTKKRKRFSWTRRLKKEPKLDK